MPKLRPAERKHDRRSETEQSAVDQIRILHLHQHQRCFHTLARDHQERKKKHTQHCGHARTLRRNRAQSFAHALLNLWTGAPHVNHERADHHDRNRAEHRFAQSFIRKELVDVAAERSAKHVLNDRRRQRRY